MESVVSESTYVREERSRTNLNGTEEQTLVESIDNHVSPDMPR